MALGKLGIWQFCQFFFLFAVHAKGTLGVPYRELTQEVYQLPNYYKPKSNNMLFKRLLKFRSHLHLIKKISFDLLRQFKKRRS